MDIKVLNSDRFTLPGTHGTHTHIASLGRGVQEYMVFLDNRTGTTYVEEVTGGSLKAVEEDELWQELVQFSQDKGFMLVPRNWPN